MICDKKGRNSYSLCSEDTERSEHITQYMNVIHIPNSYF